MLANGACGGKSETSSLADSPIDGPEMVGTGGGGPDASGSGGVDIAIGTDSGTGGRSLRPSPLPIGLGSLPLFAGTDTMVTIATPTSEESGRQGAFFISTDDASPRGVLSTHMHHFNFGTQYRAVEFSARASRSVRLMVSVSPLEGEYWSASEAGSAWQGAIVSVTEEWQDFSISFSEMVPLAEGDPQPLGTDEGSALSLMIEESEATTLWIADLALTP